VWAFEKGHQLRRNLLVIIAMSTGSLTSNTPIRRHASPRRPFSSQPSGAVRNAG
jgi:hypothetical protein